MSWWVKLVQSFAAAPLEPYDAASSARPRTPTTGRQPHTLFLRSSGQVEPKQHLAGSWRGALKWRSAKANAGPLVETLTRRVYHDAGEAKFQKKEQKGSLV
jgi:hypothetical protein